MQRDHHAAGEPDAGIGGEVERLVRNAHVNRLAGAEPGLPQRGADRLGTRKELAVAQSGERLARCEALRGCGEQSSEIQRQTENCGGWRSDCATTQ